MTLTTQSAIRQEYCRQTGGFVAAVTAAGTTTTLVSRNMIGRSPAGDDNHLAGWSTYDGTEIAGDKVRVIATNVDSTGTATLAVAITGAKAGTETIEYYPKDDPTGEDANEVMNTMFRTTHRIVESVIPTYKGQREYAFRNAPWVETISDVLDSFQRNSPNLIDNGGFESWGIGSNAGLHAWVLSGTDATVTRVDNGYGRFAARVTASGGSGAVLTQTIPIPIQQLWSETIQLSVRVNADTALMASVDVFDGTDTTQSTQHAGGSVWGDALTVSHTVNAAAAGPLQIKLTLDVTNGFADFESAVAVKGDSIPQWLSDYGNQNATTVNLDASVQVSSTGAVLRTPDTKSLGSQIAIVTKQPFFEMSANTGAGGITDMPLDAAVSGMIVKQFERGVNKANADKWERLYRLHYPKYRDWKRRLARKPKRGTTDRALVSPA